MPTAIPRSKVKSDQTWNAESLFETPADFEAAVESILKSLPAIKKFQGRLAEGSETFIKAMNAIDTLSKRAARIDIYATMSSSVDSGDQRAAAMYGKAMSLMAQVRATISFVNPELLSTGETKLRRWLVEDPKMKQYEHYMDELLRKQAHVKNAEVEVVLGHRGQVLNCEKSRDSRPDPLGRAAAQVQDGLPGISRNAARGYAGAARTERHA